MTDGLERRKAKDEPSEGQDRFLNGDIRRKLSEVSEYKAEHEGAQDRGQIGEEEKRKLSGESTKGELIDKPAEEERTGARSENSVAHAEEMRLPDAEKQTAQEAQKDRTGEQTGFDQPLGSNQMRLGLEFQSAEPSRSDEQVGARRIDETEIKQDQNAEQVARQFQEHGSYTVEKSIGSEQLVREGERQAAQVEKILEPQVERSNFEPSQGENALHRPESNLDGREYALEKPDHRNLNDERQKELFEISKQNWEDKEPSEATGSLNTPIEVKISSTTNLSIESSERKKASISEQPMRAEGMQTTQETQQTIRELPIEKASCATEHPYVINTTHEVVSKWDSSETVSKKEGAEHQAQTETKPHQLSEYAHRTSESLEPQVKRIQIAEPTQKLAVDIEGRGNGSARLELERHPDNVFWHKKLTDTKRVQRITIKPDGRIVFPAEYLERTIPGFKRGQEALLECTSEEKTFYCKYRGNDKEGPVKHMIADVPKQIGQPHEKHNFIFDKLTPEAFAKRFPETMFPNELASTGLIPNNCVLRSMVVKEGRATLEITEGDRSLTLDGLVKDFGYDERIRGAFMKIELKGGRNAVTLTAIHDGIGKARIESPSETALREDIVAFLDKVETKMDRKARGAVKKLINDIERTGNLTPRNLDMVKTIVDKALEHSPNTLIAVLGNIKKDFVKMGPERGLKTLNSYVDAEKPLPRIYTTQIKSGKTCGDINIPRIWREFRGLREGDTYAITLRDSKGTSLTIMQELRPDKNGNWRIHIDKDLSRSFPDHTVVDVTFRIPETSQIVDELNRALPQTISGIRSIRLKDRRIYLDIWNQMFSQFYTLEMNPSEKTSYQSAKIAGTCFTSKFTDYNGEEQTFRFIYKSDRRKPVMQYLENDKFRKISDIRYYEPLKRIEVLLSKRSTHMIYIDEFMGKEEEDREAVLNYHNAKDKQHKAILGHENFGNYLAKLEGASEPQEIIRYVDRISNTHGPDLVFEDNRCIFAFGCGIVEVKSLGLDTSNKNRIREKISSSLKEAINDLHRYLNGKLIISSKLGHHVPDFGLAVSQIFNKSKDNITRTIVISIRNPDGSYTEKNWRESI